MIYIQFEAMPTQRLSARDDTAGAYANCWVRTSDVAEAEQLARQLIAEQEWVVVSIEEVRRVDVAAEASGRGAPYTREATQRVPRWSSVDGRHKGRKREVKRSASDHLSERVIV
jgi:hypothetical protein